MADTKISDLDATNREALRRKALEPRGCLVGLSADLTAVNATSGYFIPFNAESYDTDNLHDNVVNNTRITVPAGWSWVRVGAKFYANSIADESSISMAIRHFNSAGVEQSRRGIPTLGADCAGALTEAGLHGTSAPIQVSAGDYFEVRIVCFPDASITLLSSHTSFWCELLS